MNWDWLKMYNKLKSIIIIKKFNIQIKIISLQNYLTVKIKF